MASPRFIFRFLLLSAGLALSLFLHGCAAFHPNTASTGQSYMLSQNMHGGGDMGDGDGDGDGHGSPGDGYGR